MSKYRQDVLNQSIKQIPIESSAVPNSFSCSLSYGISLKMIINFGRPVRSSVSMCSAIEYMA